MSTYRRSVKTYLVGKNCPECGPGEMKSTGNSTALTVHPPKYTHEHQCTHCGHKEMLDESYPKIEYE